MTEKTLKPRGREITKHKDGLGGLNDRVEVFAIDEPDHDVGGGACHHYRLSSYVDLPDGNAEATVQGDVVFQKGPLLEVGGVNGVSDDSLLAIVLDRLQSMQRGPFACMENDEAAKHVTLAMARMKQRRAQRAERGVLGKNEV